jgi:hypothetical protein
MNKKYKTEHVMIKYKHLNFWESKIKVRMKKKKINNLFKKKNELFTNYNFI